MQTLIFHPDLDPSLTRSLSLQFILQALIDANLDKLCFYCTILLQASDRKNSELPQALEGMKMEKNWDCFFESLIPFLLDARFDENVLAYLIRKKEQLNGRLKAQRIDKLLQDLFPEGKAKLYAIISEGYTRRGFLDAVASLEPLIDAIEWDRPCR